MVWLNPSRECALSGCHRTVKHPERYCAAHRRAAPKPFEGATRQATPALYKTKEWKRLRAVVLRRDPVCVVCGTQPANHVDHIVPRKHGGTNDPTNLQGLCRRCHSSKTGRGE